MSDYEVQCSTPGEVTDGFAIQNHSYELEISLVLLLNNQEYKPAKAHQTLNLAAWPVLRTLFVGETLYAEKDKRLPLLEVLVPGA